MPDKGQRKKNKAFHFSLLPCATQPVHNISHRTFAGNLILGNLSGVHLVAHSAHSLSGFPLRRKVVISAGKYLLQKEVETQVGKQRGDQMPLPSETFAKLEEKKSTTSPSSSGFADSLTALPQHASTVACGSCFVFINPGKFSAGTYPGSGSGQLSNS